MRFTVDSPPVRTDASLAWIDRQGSLGDPLALAPLIEAWREGYDATATISMALTQALIRPMSDVVRIHRGAPTMSRPLIPPAWARGYWARLAQGIANRDSRPEFGGVEVRLSRLLRLSSWPELEVGCAISVSVPVLDPFAPATSTLLFVLASSIP